MKTLIIQLIILAVPSLSYMTGNEWFCKDNTFCQPWKKSLQPQPENIYETQNICRLMCGDYGGLWPKPWKCELTKHVIDVSAVMIRFDYPKHNSEMRDFLDHLTIIFQTNLNDECGNECDKPSDIEMLVTIHINSTSLKLFSGTDESYQLNIKSNSSLVTVEIFAQNVFGARHGLETLSQLMVKRVDDMQRNGLVIVSGASISDKPAFQHRGLLLDTARHFIPKPVILRILAGMSSVKMNVFHWHITDVQSFPMESKSLPQMTLHGAYSEDEVYRQADIESIIKYAKYRGIRLIMELDGPAHAGHGYEWGPQEGLGNLAVCVDRQPWKKSCIAPNCGQLNPANENVYAVLKKLFEDIRDYKEADEFLHLGGDEVFMACWNNTKEVTDYMKKKNYNRDVEGFLKLWSEFQEKALNVWDEVTGNHNDSIILWSSDLTSPGNIQRYLTKKRYIIQTWVSNSSPIPNQLMKKGYRVIISTKDAWYFDHGFWGSTKYYKWKTVYGNKLPANPLVLGGEACMWTEFCDANAIEIKIWPRLIAVAERLWSNPSDSIKTVEPRFNRQRERLIAKGIPVDAVTLEYCRLFEGEC